MFAVVITLHWGSLFRFMKEHNLIADSYKRGNEEALVESVRNHQLMFKENILKSSFLNGICVRGSTRCSEEIYVEK